jgi:TetR/AcrR family transcriptional regulator
MSKRSKAAAQDLGTEERIRRAALKEFAEKGLSGARVDRIAQEADVNIRMIYYFFGSKEGLLEAVLSEIFNRRKAELPSSYDSVADLLTSYFDGYAEDSQRVRLLQWEALQTPLPEGVAKLTNFKDRREVVRQRIDAIAELQQRGVVPDRFDPKLLYLMFVALSIYPMTFPQSTFIATGEHVGSESFKRRYRDFLRELAETLFSPSAQPAASSSASKRSNGAAATGRARKQTSRRKRTPAQPRS